MTYLSFIIGDEMNLYEHQSTFCPNLPLRGLFYFSSVYKSYIEPVKRKLYSTSELKIPFPQYIIFYNGIEERPEREELELGKLFVGNGKGKKPSLECTALVLNVNYGHNKELLERCKTLKEYAQFIATIRRNLAYGMKAQEAVEQAADEYRDYLKEEGIKIGEERGKIENTIEMCQEFQFSKESTMDRIIKRFSLEEEDAKTYMEKYWK